MINEKRLKKLVHKLIDIYSPSGKEKDVLDYLKQFLKQKGVNITVQPVDEERYNLLILPPEDVDMRLAFIGHLDTVPAYDLDNYEYEEDGDTIKGLGAADMKSGCAAMIEAYISFVESEGYHPPAAVCLVVGEEETGDGADALIEDYHFPWAIIGEPTDQVPCMGSYGYLEIYIESQGKRMHASLAKRKKNAIENLLYTILRMSSYLEHKRPDVVYNIRDLYSIHSGFAVPEKCEAWIDIHLPPAAPIGEIVTELEEIAIRHPGEHGETRVQFQIVTIDSGYELPVKGKLPETLQAVFKNLGIPWETGLFRSHSDANQLWAAGIKPIILGPGKLEMAHAQDESVSFIQTCQSATVYLNLLQRLFSTAESTEKPTDLS